MEHPLLNQVDELVKNLGSAPATEEILTAIIKKSEAALYNLKAQRNGLINDPNVGGFRDGEVMNERP